MYQIVDIKNVASYDTDYRDSLDHETEPSEKQEFLSLNSPKIVAITYCSRRPGYYIFNAFFLIFLITVSSLTIFSIDPKLPQARLQTTYTLLLTSVSFKWVVNRSLPTISYLTSLDQYAIACIFFVCSLCVWHSIVGSGLIAASDAKGIDQWFLIGFASFFVLIHIFFIIKFGIGYGETRKLKQREKASLAQYKTVPNKFIKEMMSETGGIIFRGVLRV